MATPPAKVKNLMVGKWIPAQRDLLLKWVKKEMVKLRKNKEKQYKKLKEYFPDGSEEEVIQEFQRNIGRIKEIQIIVGFNDCILPLLTAMGTEPNVGMLIVEMFRQQNIEGVSVIDMLFLLNEVVRFAPRYIDQELGISIPVPIGCIMTFAMATPAGFGAFVNNRVNELFKIILDDYGRWLTTSDSQYVLVSDIPGGWFSPKALEAMPNFAKTFPCNPEADYWGYASFDAFFTRTFYDSARPIAYEDDDNVIVNACENAPYQVSYCVGRYDAFWIKTQPYSLQYILNNDEELIKKFEGGTIYQGFLSPHTYHRFHAPCSGKVKKAEVVPGTYFSQPYYTDSSANYIASQPYLAHVAARGIIAIEADNKALGTVVFVPIGMVDVSTVDLKPMEGKERVKKGENIGTFHFGGSSHLLIFEPGKQLAFDFQGIKPDPNGEEFLNVRSRIATLVPENAVPYNK